MYELGIIGNVVAGNYSSLSSLTGSASASSDAAVLILIAVYLTFRAYRGMSGIRFKSSRLYLMPIIYLVLTVASLFILNPSYLDMAVVFLAVVVGLFVGLGLAGGVQFYEKNEKAYYKRSPFIMAVWLASFIARFAVEFFLPSNFYLGFAVEIVLAATTGMIIGEAFHINRNYNKYKVQKGIRSV